MFFQIYLIVQSFCLDGKSWVCYNKKMYREDNMWLEIYHIFIICGIIAKEWRKEMSNAPKNKEK